MRIDWWTLALQTVNVLVLVWLLKRFLYRPVMDMIAQRRTAADKMLTDASAVRERALAAEAEVGRRNQALAADRDRMLAEAHAQAEAEKSAMLERSAQEAAQRQAEGEAAIAREQEAMRRGVLEQAAKLAVVIARKLLSRLPPKVATAALLEPLPAALAELPDEVRAHAAATGEPIEVVTAAPLDESGQTRCRTLLATILHGQPTVTFRADPDLIAGVELRASHLLIRNSWRADLDRITRELSREDAGADAPR